MQPICVLTIFLIYTNKSTLSLFHIKNFTFSFNLEEKMLALLVAAVCFSAAIADPMTAVQLQPR